MTVARFSAAVKLPGLQGLDGAPDILFVFAETFLQAAEELVFLPLGKCQVIIGKLTVFLLKLPFQLVPVSFYFKFGTHTLSFVLNWHSGRAAP